MFDPILLSLMNQLAREGMKEETEDKLTVLFDTLLTIDDYDTINIVNVQTLLLLLQDFDSKPIIKRLIDELRYRLIRQSLGKNWRHGMVTTEYTLNEMDKSLLTRIDKVFVYEDGTIDQEPLFSIQPNAPKDSLLLNDMGQLALNN